MRIGRSHTESLLLRGTVVGKEDSLIGTARKPDC